MNWVTTRDLADVCGVHATTVAKWIHAGKIEAYKLGPGIRSPFVFTPDVVDRFGRDLRELAAARQAA